MANKRYILKVGDGLASDSTGEKLAYTVPSSPQKRKAIITAASWINNSGTPTVQLEIVRGGTTVVLFSGSSFGVDKPLSINLEAGDKIRWNVAIAAAGGSTADATISIQELL